jgi:hypothetical protein
MLFLILLQAATLDPEGVYIDSDGVLQTRKVDTGAKLRELRKKARETKSEAGMVYISLPRLFAEAKAKLAAGQKLPDEMRFLRGMVKLQYVFVFDDDLVIAGRAEPFDPAWPVGQVTGRPILQLDDLVVALRTCGPGKAGAAFGCTIQNTAEGQKRMVEKLKELTDVVKKEPSKRRDVADQMAEAAGLQPVKFFNIEPSTRFAYVCVEADYLLKRHALELDKSPVPEVQSHISMKATTDTMSNRFWFEAKYDALGVSPDGRSFEIRGPSLQVKTRKSFSEDESEKADPLARAYAESVTKHFTRLSEFILPYADLANLADLSVAAALIGQEKLAEAAGWDASWALNEYPVAKVAVPDSARTLANFKVNSGMVIYAGGGVLLCPSEPIKERAADDAVAAQAKRPSGDW